AVRSYKIVSRWVWVWGLVAVPDTSRLVAQTDALPANALARFGTTRFRTDSYVEMLAFSPDGRQIVSWDSGGYEKPGSLVIWDATTGRPITAARTAPDQRIQAMAWAAGRPGLAVFKRAGLAGGNRDLITDLTVWDFTADSSVRLEKPKEVVVRPGEPAP